MKDRYNIDVKPMEERLIRLQEEWEYALTRKQRELIEREMALLKKL